MRVGITYDLRQDYRAMGMSEEETAEFDRPDTIEAIEDSLSALGYGTERIGNVHRLVELLASGHRWDMVFNIAEGIFGYGRESQVPALLDAYRIPYTFSGPMVLALTLHKAMAKRVVRDAKIPTPLFAVVEKPSDIEKISLPTPLFAKPIAEGSSKGIDEQSLVTEHRDLWPVCLKLLETFNQPVLVEEYLPGREFTVGILGTGRDARPIGVVEVSITADTEEIYSYETKERYETMVSYTLTTDETADRAQQMALEVWRLFGCRDAGRVDVRADGEGELHFLEVNPLAGLNPKRSDLCIIAAQSGLTYREIIEEIMVSAIDRNVDSEYKERMYRHG
jgi:D-alanine-D-alanine ligase